jgi:aminobenzoyl-glutamate utilization protein B
MLSSLHTGMLSRAVLTMGIIVSITSVFPVTVSAQSTQAVDNARRIVGEWVDAHQERVIEISDAIWQYAEPPWEEFQSMTLLSDELSKEGFTVQKHVAGLPTAFVASFTHGSGEPVIGIVAEYDTPTQLGLSQQAAVPYKDELVPGHYGHACGHNMIGASSMSAAIAIKDAMVQAGISGTIKFFGTPAEEELTGKVYMVDAGLFSDVDAALAWHPGPNFEARYGINEAMLRVKFVFTGNSLPQAAEAALELKELAGNVNRSITTRQNTAQIHIVETGKTVAEAKQNIEAIRKEAERIAEETGTYVEDFLVIGSHERLPNERLVTLLDTVMREFAPLTYTPDEFKLAKEISGTFDDPPPDDELMPQMLPPSRNVGGLNDNGDVSWVTPFISVRGGTYVNGISSHTWQQTSLAASSIGHKGLVTMAKVIAIASLELMASPELLAQVRQEFEKNKRGRTYQAVIPQDKNWRWVRE